MIVSFKDKFRFLSNFYPDPIMFGGQEYATLEHAFQAAKTLDPAERKRIEDLDTPGQAKRAGRKVTLRPEWDAVRQEVMEALLRTKFRPGGHLSLRLLQTGHESLLEGNTWHDNFWGQCCCLSCLRVRGYNHLGRLLMKVRAQGCDTCAGTGVVDSGGENPYGSPVSVPCHECN